MGPALRQQDTADGSSAAAVKGRFDFKSLLFRAEAVARTQKGPRALQGAAPTRRGTQPSPRVPLCGKVGASQSSCQRDVPRVP
jgi:hypothetical protein